MTELLTGVNLPAAQLLIAMGVPLHRNPEIRKMYGENVSGDSKIPFKTADRVSCAGHGMRLWFLDSVTGECG